MASDQRSRLGWPTQALRRFFTFRARQQRIGEVGSAFMSGPSTTSSTSSLETITKATLEKNKLAATTSSTVILVWERTHPSENPDYFFLFCHRALFQLQSRKSKDGHLLPGQRIKRPLKLRHSSYFDTLPKFKPLEPISATMAFISSKSEESIDPTTSFLDTPDKGSFSDSDWDGDENPHWCPIEELERIFILTLPDGSWSIKPFDLDADISPPDVNGIFKNNCDSGNDDDDQHRQFLFPKAPERYSYRVTLPTILEEKEEEKEERCFDEEKISWKANTRIESNSQSEDLVEDLLNENASFTPGKVEEPSSTPNPSIRVNFDK